VSDFLSGMTRAATSRRSRTRTRGKRGRVERWRGGLGSAYRLPALSSAGASLALPCSVSTSRSSNRTCRFPASGSRTRFMRSPTRSGGEVWPGSAGPEFPGAGRDIGRIPAQACRSSAATTDGPGHRRVRTRPCTPSVDGRGK
jgi:hypothetical protein